MLPNLDIDVQVLIQRIMDKKSVVTDIYVKQCWSPIGAWYAKMTHVLGIGKLSPSSNQSHATPPHKRQEPFQ